VPEAIIKILDLMSVTNFLLQVFGLTYKIDALIYVGFDNPRIPEAIAYMNDQLMKMYLYIP
jgi:hypothetical protein